MTHADEPLISKITAEMPPVQTPIHRIQHAFLIVYIIRNVRQFENGFCCLLRQVPAAEAFFIYFPEYSYLTYVKMLVSPFISADSSSFSEKYRLKQVDHILDITLFARNNNFYFRMD
jgi:hypothetical protein